MSKQGYQPDYTDTPDLNRLEYQEFRFNFQRSILLSLLSNGKLSQSQFDCCVEKLTRQYAKVPNL